MRVLLVAPDLAPATGGPRRAVTGLARALASRGVQVTVATTDVGLGGALPRADDVEFRVFPCPAFRGRRWSPGLSRFLTTEIARYDVVGVHALWQHPTAAAARACRRANVPYVVVPHGMLEAWALAQNRWRKRAYLALVERATLAGASALWMTSQGEQRNSKPERWNRSVFVLPWGLDPAVWSDVPPTDRFASRWPGLAGKRVVLFLGRLHRKKQPDVVIRAFELACASDPEARLVLAGPGAPRYVASLERLARRLRIADRVVFTGLLDEGAAREACAAAAVFVLPSWQENFGHAVVEAMAAGCPVIVSDRVGLASEIAAAGAGLVVPPTVEATAEAMRRLLADDALRREMGARGRALVLERFTWDRVVDELLVVYDDILSGRRRSSAWRPVSETRSPSPVS